MPVTPPVTYPGVYVQEVPSGVRTIVGVSTSVAMFVGRAKKGILNKPFLCTNPTDFKKEFSYDTSVSEMPQHVKLFFENGGTKCYIMRIADGAEPATVTLKNEDKKEVILVTAKQAGITGDFIRIAVTYGGQNPEVDFNMEIFQYEIDTNGRKSIVVSESYKNLSMDKNSPKYAIKYINQNSKLVILELKNTAPEAENGFSQSLRPVQYSTTGTAEEKAKSIRDAWEALIGSNSDTNEFEVSVDGFGPVHIDLKSLDLSTFTVTKLTDFKNAFKNNIKSIINTALTDAGSAGVTVDVSVEDGPVPAAADTASTLLRISSGNTGNVFIFPSSTNDLAVPLMFGTAQGGIEIGANAKRRPAPSGISFRASDSAKLISLAQLVQKDLKKITIGDEIGFDTTNSEEQIFKNKIADTSPLTGDNDGIREKLRLMRDGINDYASDNPRKFFWKAELTGYRLTIIQTQGDDNLIANPFSTSTTDIAASFINNARYYSLGKTGLGKFQTQGAEAASDGNPPKTTDYGNAFEIIDKEVDLFNLLVLPADKDAAAKPVSNVWGKASKFCLKRRAFLLMDAPDWKTVQAAQDEIANYRIGLVKDHSAIFFPKLKVRRNGVEDEVGASGAIAGLMSRIDSTRGVWKAPAGTEADIRGISGINTHFTDNENGVLNPRAINTIRVFPNGIVNWGARTMDGDDDFASEYKYIPVRRLALYMEESLYRGLKWVVFEPNDEPLWSQIRLNVGAFMHNLFRQGAFQGEKPKDAYFVKCDKETTTQDDINRGIVNIWVGFAPLKPAEFVIIYLQQMAGQIEV